jgi:transposase, IS5 family
MAIQVDHQTPIWGWLVQQVVDPTHALLVLARQMDGEAITLALRPSYHKLGRYAKPIRLMVGLHLLKHRENLAEARVVQGLHAQLYGMVFCGIDLGEVREQAKPGPSCRFVEASTLTTWRKRLGPAGTHVLDAVSQPQLVRAKMGDGQRRATDTTAQEKHLAYPLDTALLNKGRRKLYPLRGDATAAGLAVAQGLRSFNRRAKQVVAAAAKVGKDRLGRIQAANRQLSAMAQHVLPRVPRVVTQVNGKLGALRRQGLGKAAAAVPRRRDQLRQTASLVPRIIHQTAERFQGRHGPAKVLSLHEPQVGSSCTGKRTKPTAYGCKVSVSIDRHGFGITPTAYACNLADAATLPDAIGGWRKVFGQPPPELAGDRGLHHSAADRARLGTATAVHLRIPRKGKTRHPDADTAWFKRVQRFRSHLEPVLSHLKADHRMDRCRYRGFAGDPLNVSGAVLAWHTKKWGRLLHQRLLAAQSWHRRAA